MNENSVLPKLYRVKIIF